MMTPEDKHARRVFMHLDAIQDAITDKATMVSQDALRFYRERGGESATLPDAFAAEVARVRTELMHYISHSDSDLDTLEINGAPWPKPEDFPAEEAALVLDQALDESIGENPERVEAPADPAVDLAAENERLRARLAQLESSPPPSPAIAALEGMEALKAKIDAGRASVPADMVEALAGEDVSSPAAIQKLTERLNIEKAELRRERAAGDMPTEREKQVDRLLNWLAQFGEA